MVKVYIKLTELNRYVNVAVQKIYLWRIWKEIFPAIYRLIRTRRKTAVKTQEKHVVQTALRSVRSP